MFNIKYDTVGLRSKLLSLQSPITFPSKALRCLNVCGDTVVNEVYEMKFPECPIVFKIRSSFSRLT